MLGAIPAESATCLVSDKCRTGDLRGIDCFCLQADIDHTRKKPALRGKRWFWERPSEGVTQAHTSSNLMNALRLAQSRGARFHRNQHILLAFLLLTDVKTSELSLSEKVQASPHSGAVTTPAPENSRVGENRHDPEKMSLPARR